MRKPRKSTSISLKKDSNSLIKRMKSNIMTDFSDIFENESQMWNVLSAEFDNVKSRDAEMMNGLNKLGGTLSKFNETQEILRSKDGINIEQALAIAKKRKGPPNEEYPFILFVLLKNFEHSGLIKINKKAERIARKAMSDYEAKKRK